ncbi:MAG: hypothetical protein AAGA19_09315, partial [Pseudomonadota bacterium]
TQRCLKLKVSTRKVVLQLFRQTLQIGLARTQVTPSFSRLPETSGTTGRAEVLDLIQLCIVRRRVEKRQATLCGPAPAVI